MTAHLFFTIILLGLLPTAPPTHTSVDGAADRALLDIQAHFGTRPRAESERALRELTGRWPQTVAGGRALLWLGDLALNRADVAAAEAAYRALQRRFAAGDLHSLALRGLGNAALANARWSLAVKWFTAAAEGASPIIVAEVDEKRAIALREHHRFIGETIAWGALALCLLYFGRTLFRRGRKWFPATTQMLLPVYALFVFASFGLDPAVRSALIYLGSGSLLLTFVAGDEKRETFQARIMDALVFTIGNIGILFIALRHAGIIDIVLETLKAGSEVG